MPLHNTAVTVTIVTLHHVSHAEQWNSSCLADPTLALRDGGDGEYAPMWRDLDFLTPILYLFFTCWHVCICLSLFFPLVATLSSFFLRPLSSCPHPPLSPLFPLVRAGVLWSVSVCVCCCSVASSPPPPSPSSYVSQPPPPRYPRACQCPRARAPHVGYRAQLIGHVLCPPPHTHCNDKLKIPSLCRRVL